jgi:hypothetical protein
VLEQGTPAILAYLRDYDARLEAYRRQWCRTRCAAP